MKKYILLFSLSMFLIASNLSLNAQVLWHADPNSSLKSVFYRFDITGSSSGSCADGDNPDPTVSTPTDGTYGKHWQIYKPKNRKRAEFARTEGTSSSYSPSEGDVFYLGWRWKIKSTPDVAGGIAVFQCKTDDGNNSVPNTQNYPFNIGYGNGKLTVSCYGPGEDHYWENGTSITTQKTTVWEGSVSEDQWVKLVFKIKVSSNKNTGYIEFYYNGVKQTLMNSDYKDYQVTLSSDKKRAYHKTNDGKQIYFKWGSYNANSCNFATTTSYDEMRIAKSYNELGLGTIDDDDEPSGSITVESVDAEQSPNVAENLFDGNTADASRWSAQGFPKSVVLDYGSTKSITGTKVWTYNDRSYHYTIGISNSPSSGFTTVVNQSGTSSSQPIQHSFAATSGRYVKLTVTGATGYSSNWVSITEFDIIEGGSTTIPVSGVSLNPSSTSIIVGETKSLSASVSPSNATNKSVSYSSSNSSVVTVSGSGVISGVGVGSATITVTTADGNKTDNCLVTVSSGGGGTGCSYEPMTSALPTINTGFSNMYVTDNGPDLSNIRKFSINWNLTNKGLYTFAFNTKNGSPSWYVDMKSAVNHTLNSIQPSITVSGSEISGFDGHYYAIMDGDNFVLEEKTGAYTIYFSNSSTAPDCDGFKSAQGFEDERSSISVYPNPVIQQFLYITGLSESKAQVMVTDMLGKTLLVENVNSQLNAIDVSTLKAGTYILIVTGEEGQISKLFNKL